MRKITIYTTPWCGFCHRAKGLLKAEGLPFEEIDTTGDPERRAWLREVTGQSTVPQIFFGDESIGGSDELAALHRSGKLHEKLNDA